MEVNNNQVEKESEYFPKKSSAVRRSNINREQLHDPSKKSNLQSLGRTQLSPTRKLSQRVWKNSGENKSTKKNIIFGSIPEPEKIDKVTDEADTLKKNIINTSASIQINQFNKQYIGYTNPGDSIKYLNESTQKHSKIVFKQRSSKNIIDINNKNEYQNAIEPVVQPDQKGKRRVDLSCTSERSQRKEILRKFSKKFSEKYIKLEATMQRSKQEKDGEETIERIQKQYKQKKYEEIEYAKSKSRQKSKNYFFLSNSKQKIKLQSKESYNSLQNSKQYFCGKEKKEIITNTNRPIFQIKHSKQEMEAMAYNSDMDIAKKISSYLTLIDAFAKLAQDIEMHQINKFWYCKTYLLQREIFELYLSKLYEKVKKSKNEENLKKLFLILEAVRKDNQSIHQSNNKIFSKYLNAEEGKTNKNNRKEIMKTIAAQIDILKKKSDSVQKKTKIKLLYNCLDAIQHLREGKIQKQLEDIYF